MEHGLKGQDWQETSGEAAASAEQQWEPGLRQEPSRQKGKSRRFGRGGTTELSPKV